MLVRLEARLRKAEKLANFTIVTDTETMARDLRKYGRRLYVIVDAVQFRQLRERIYVLDECGRVAYVFPFPFSYLKKPLIKAAVLSTIHDRPCGPCDSLVS